MTQKKKLELIQIIISWTNLKTKKNKPTLQKCMQI